MTKPLFLGIDIGTSGIRGSCIDENNTEITGHQIPFEQAAVSSGIHEQNPNRWLRQLDQLLLSISEKLQQQAQQHHICAVSIDGTSSTLIACKKNGDPLSPALMYNDQQSQPQADIIRRFAPADSAVHGASSSLAKALYLLERYPDTERFCHQADWLAASLTGSYGISDENNCLKLGYDSRTQCWPHWLHKNSENAVIAKSLLPTVVAPGTKTARVDPALCKKYRFSENCIMVAGTTDSNAAVLATGASQIGDAVTSLGSTLVIKVFSQRPIFNPEYGIYSHRLNNHWLVGGASNSGGGVLLQHFSQEKLDKMTPQLKPEQATGLNYYPLPATGERFPVNDSHKQSKITPRPSSELEFFQALLEGIASIEAEGYNKLKMLGASAAKRIFTAGGGNKNPAWTLIRKRITGLDIVTPGHSDACYGSALLAKKGYLASSIK